MISRDRIHPQPICGKDAASNEILVLGFSLEGKLYILEECL